MGFGFWIILSNVIIVLQMLQGKIHKKEVNLIFNESMSIDLDEFDLAKENYSVYYSQSANYTPETLRVTIPTKIKLVRDSLMSNNIQDSISFWSSDEDFYFVNRDCSVVEKSSYGQESFYHVENSNEAITCLETIAYNTESIHMLLLNAVLRSSENTHLIFSFDLYKKRFKRLYSINLEKTSRFSKFFSGDDEVVIIWMLEGGLIMLKAFRVDDELGGLYEKRDIHFSMRQYNPEENLLNLFFKRSDSLDSFRIILFYSNHLKTIEHSFYSKEDSINSSKMGIPGDLIATVRKSTRGFGSNIFIEKYWLFSITGSIYQMLISSSNSIKFIKIEIQASKMEAVDLLAESDKYSAIKLEKKAEGLVVERSIMLLDKKENIFYSGSLNLNADNFFSEIKYMKFQGELVYALYEERFSILRVSNHFVLQAGNESLSTDISLYIKNEEEKQQEKIILSVSIAGPGISCQSHSSSKILNLTLIYPEIRITQFPEILKVPALAIVQVQNDPISSLSISKATMHELLNLRTPFNEREDPIYIHTSQKDGDLIPETTSQRTMSDIIQLNSRKIYLMGSLTFFKEENLIYYDENHSRLPNLPKEDDILSEAHVIRVKFDFVVMILKGSKGRYFIYSRNKNEEPNFINTNIDLRGGCQKLNHFLLGSKIFLLCLSGSSLKVFYVQLTKNQTFLENYESTQANFPQGEGSNLIICRKTKESYAIIVTIFTEKRTTIYNLDFSLTSLLSLRGSQVFQANIQISLSLSGDKLLFFQPRDNSLTVFDTFTFILFLNTKGSQLMPSKKTLPLYGHLPYHKPGESILKAIFYDNYIVLATLNNDKRRMLLVYDITKPSSFCLIHIIELNEKFDSTSDLLLEPLFRTPVKSRVHYVLIRLFKNIYTKIFLHNSLITWSLAPFIFKSESHNKSLTLISKLDENCKFYLKFNVKSFYYPDFERTILSIKEIPDVYSKTQIAVPEDKSSNCHRLGLKLQCECEDYFTGTKSKNCAEEGFKINSKTTKTQGSYLVEALDLSFMEFKTLYNVSGKPFIISVDSELGEVRLQSKLDPSKTFSKLNAVGLKGTITRIVYKDDHIAFISMREDLAKFWAYIIAVESEGFNMKLVWSDELGNFLEFLIDDISFDLSSANGSLYLIFANMHGESSVMEMKLENNEFLTVESITNFDLKQEIYKHTSIDLNMSSLKNINFMSSVNTLHRILVIFDNPFSAEIAINTPDPKLLGFFKQETSIFRVYRGYNRLANTGVHFISSEAVLFLTKQVSENYGLNHLTFVVLVYYFESNNNPQNGGSFTILNVGDSLQVQMKVKNNLFKLVEGNSNLYFQLRKKESADSEYCLSHISQNYSNFNCFRISKDNATLSLPYMTKHNCTINVSIENTSPQQDEEFETYLYRDFSSIYDYNPPSNFEELLAMIVFYIAVVLVSLLILVMVIIIIVRKKKGHSLIEEFVSDSLGEAEGKDGKIYQPMRNSSEIELGSRVNQGVYDSVIQNNSSDVNIKNQL